MFLVAHLDRYVVAVEHHAIDQLRDEDGAIDGIRLDLAYCDFGAARHYEPFLAPYLERPCLRSGTPDASSAARITL